MEPYDTDEGSFTHTQGQPPDSALSDEEYFMTTIWPHYSSIKKLFYTMTLNSALAEDLTQDTMMLCWKKLNTMRTYENIPGALRVIARRLCLAYLRQNKNTAEISIDFDTLRYLPSCSNIAESIERDNNIHRLLFLFSDVKKEYIQVVLLADYYGFSLKDIARILHKNYNTVVSHHSRGLEEMRRNGEKPQSSVKF